ncbi:MAG: FYDLN acid domain-containing protein [Crinalium sp.]
MDKCPKCSKKFYIPGLDASMCIDCGWVPDPVTLRLTLESEAAKKEQAEKTKKTTNKTTKKTAKK